MRVYTETPLLETADSARARTKPRSSVKSSEVHRNTNAHPASVVEPTGLSLARHRPREGQGERQREREKGVKGSERQRERQRGGDRETERQ